jgi:hypothetical protein
MYFGNASIQASLLSKVVENAKDLKVFSLGCVELEGNRDDFSDLEFSIRHHQALTQLVWEDFAIIDSDVKVDGIILALSVVRTLEVVNLAVSQESTSMSLDGQSLTSLCKSLSLRQMHFSHFQLG